MHGSRGPMAHRAPSILPRFLPTLRTMMSGRRRKRKHFGWKRHPPDL